HSHESGNPFKFQSFWIPVYTGMTILTHALKVGVIATSFPPASRDTIRRAGRTWVEFPSSTCWGFNPFSKTINLMNLS
ncbi:MAG: hypothetical protein KJ666_12515, partial [Bacteroidetes bacterium]|nr:hypothetical protein [Bacteroidota bacterium]